MPTLQEAARISLKTILVPTDFSPASRAALPFALALARAYGSTLLLTHVLPSQPYRQIVTDRVPAHRDRAWQSAQRALSELSADRRISDTASKTLLKHGDLAEVIPEIIREQTVDMVVLGTHGRTGVSKMVLGSGAEKIYRSAPCPVLTVGPKVRDGEWKLDRILCPVDLVDDPGPFLRYALALAEPSQSEFMLLLAVPMVPWQHRDTVEKQMRERLKRLIPGQGAHWCNPQFLVRWEHPAEAVLLAAAEWEVDLIVMGVRKARAAGLSSHLPWPVASEVVSQAPCPVLTVRV